MGIARKEVIELSNAIHIGSQIDKGGVEAIKEAIKEILNASFDHRSNMVTCKALETLQDATDISVSNVSISGCHINMNPEKEDNDEI